MKNLSVSASWVVLMGGWSIIAASTVSFGEFYRVRYETAKAQYEAAPTDDRLAWAYARAVFDWGDYSKSKDEREARAKEGIEVSRELLARNPSSVEGHYGLALNLGQLARVKLFKALGIVAEMEEAFHRAHELDPEFDFAGPTRCLGLVYLDAPRWPLSIGNRKKSLQHLELALEICREYPDNHLTLIEAYLKLGKIKKAKNRADSVPEVMEKARLALTGPRWESTWLLWDKRWEGILKKLKSLSTLRRFP